MSKLTVVALMDEGVHVLLLLFVILVSTIFTNNPGFIIHLITKSNDELYGKSLIIQHCLFLLLSEPSNYVLLLSWQVTVTNTKVFYPYSSDTDFLFGCEELQPGTRGDTLHCPTHKYFANTCVYIYKCGLSVKGCSLTSERRWGVVGSRQLRLAFLWAEN